jgi:SAM-dependent methyltransferase
MKILDIGGAGGKYPNSISIDKLKHKDTDIVFDFDGNKLPFDDNYFDKIYSSMTIEHVVNLDLLLREIHRISKPDGIVIFRLPHFTSCFAQDIDHKRLFALRSLEEYLVDYQFPKTTPKLFKMVKRRLCWLMKYHKDDEYGDGFCMRFNTLKHKMLYIFVDIIDYLANFNQILSERLWCYWVGGFDEIYMVLKVKK